MKETKVTQQENHFGQHTEDVEDGINSHLMVMKRMIEFQLSQSERRAAYGGEWGEASLKRNRCVSDGADDECVCQCSKTSVCQREDACGAKTIIGEKPLICLKVARKGLILRGEHGLVEEDEASRLLWKRLDWTLGEGNFSFSGWTPSQDHQRFPKNQRKPITSSSHLVSCSCLPPTGQLVNYAAQFLAPLLTCLDFFHFLDHFELKHQTDLIFFFIIQVDSR